ncbi:MAG: amidohydrolase [Bacillota bacterium]
MLAIVGGKIYPVTAPVIEYGTVLVEGDKIAAVLPGRQVPAGAQVIDAAGMTVLPGFIDAHCHVGIVEEIYRQEGDDVNEVTDPLQPHLRAIDAINPADLAFADALAAGVTTVVVAPGSANVLGGEMVALHTAGRSVEEMLVKEPVGVKAALGENPKRSYGGRSKAPATRMAAAALLREALTGAASYLEKWQRFAAGQGEAPEKDLKKEALARVLRQEIPLRVHAHRADDILTALRIAREFDIKLVIEHCTEGYKIADILAQHDVPTVIGPVITNRAKVELKDISLTAAARLEEAGVQFAVMTDHPVVPVQYLALSAGLTQRGGLSEAAALAAVTIRPARILGLEDRLGSLEVGKQADIVIMNGHPFDLCSQVVLVLINGRPVYNKGGLFEQDMISA